MLICRSPREARRRRGSPGVGGPAPGGDESRGAGPGVVQRPAARDEPGGGPGVARNAQAPAATALFHRRRLRLELGDRAGGGRGLPRCQRGCRGVHFHGRARRRLWCGGARVRGRSAMGLGSTPASAQLGPVGNSRGLAVRPGPTQSLRPRCRRRRDRYASTRARLPGGAQRDRLRTAWPRGRRPGGRDLRRPLVLGSSRVAAAGGGAPRAAGAYLSAGTAGSVATSTRSSCGARSSSAATSSSKGRCTCSAETAANGRALR